MVEKQPHSSYTRYNTYFRTFWRHCDSVTQKHLSICTLIVFALSSRYDNKFMEAAQILFNKIIIPLELFDSKGQFIPTHLNVKTRLTRVNAKLPNREGHINFKMNKLYLCLLFEWLFIQMFAETIVIISTCFGC